MDGGGVRKPALEVQAQNLVQELKVPLGKRLQIARAPAAAQDAEHRQQQQVPLGDAPRAGSDHREWL